MPERLPIVIVGGGVAGLAVANALACRGLRSLVIERTSRAGEVDRGDVLHQSSLSLINKWHIDDVLARYEPLKINSFRILKETGDELFRYDLSRDPVEPTTLTVLKHPEIERFLEEAATRTGLVEVKRDESCVNLLTYNRSVIGVQTSRGDYKAALTVIANGARSSLRDTYFGSPAHYEYPVSFYNACFKQLPQYAHSGYYVLGGKGVIIMLPLPRNEMRIGIQYFKGDVGQSISLAHALEMIGARLQSIPLGSLEFLNAHVYKVFKSISDRWSIPGAVLAGDAAHTTHPVGGQGMNLAFQDAEALAESLVEFGGIESPSARQEACDNYSSRRRREVIAVLRRTHIAGLMGCIRSPLFIRAREHFLKLANAVPPIKRAVFRRIIQGR